MVEKPKKRVPREEGGQFSDDFFPELHNVKTVKDCVAELVQSGLTEKETEKIDEVISLLINKKTEQIINNIYEQKY